MNMYNMMFGQNPVSGLLLSMVALKREQTGRFRDAHPHMTEDGTRQVAVYTRNGGGNREHYDDDVEEGKECGCTGCTIEYALPEHPFYSNDEDDDFDCTYATIYFNVPEALHETYDTLFTGTATETPAEKWDALLTGLANNDTDNPLVKDALEKVRPIVEQIREALEKK